MNTQNVSLLCRACLNSDELKPLCTSQLHIIYEKITNLKIETDDKLPQNICTACSNKLEDISKFIDTCKLSDKYLKTLIDEEIDIKNDDSFYENENLDDMNSSMENEKNVSPTILDKSLSDTSKEIKNSCDTCGKSFVKNEALERHKKIHSEAKSFECKACDKKFSQKSVLWRHFLIHTGDKPFECNLCGKQTRRKNQIQDHIQKHHPNVPNEEYKTIITRKQVTLLDHEIYKATIPFIDSKIEREINDAKSELHRSESDIKTESELAETKTEFQESKSDLLGVPVNTQEVESEAELKVEKTESDVEGAEFQIEENPPAKKKRLELCLCSLCGKQFKRNEYLKNHMATHMNIKPYTCSVCGAGFTQRQALSRHNLVHTKERPHKCTYCDKSFTRKEKLTDHIRCHEEGVPPHLCFHCGRRFKDREYLRKHLHYHLMGGKHRWRPESKRCLCPECGKEFHSEAYLKKHLNIHTGEKPFTCEICNKTFSVSAGLDYHMKIHKGMKPFKCTHLQCNKAFRTNYALKIHAKMHGNERPFKCTICSKGFVRNSHLKRHLKLHEDHSEPIPANT